jgi:hypothetical protein
MVTHVMEAVFTQLGVLLLLLGPEHMLETRV